MKDIGAIFKEKRETIGISKNEICTDLEITEAQLDNLEEGNSNAFKDIFYFKELILKYAKYLDVDENLIINEFNDFVFNMTSKIPIEKIEERVKEIKEEEKDSPKKIISPYTRSKDLKTKRKNYLIYIFSILLAFTIIILIILLIKSILNL